MLVRGHSPGFFFCVFHACPGRFRLPVVMSPDRLFIFLYCLFLFFSMFPLDFFLVHPGLLGCECNQHGQDGYKQRYE